MCVKEKESCCCTQYFPFSVQKLVKIILCPPLFNVFSQAAAERVPPLPQSWCVAWGDVSQQRGGLSTASPRVALLPKTNFL